jgi:hypothetical protein
MIVDLQLSTLSLIKLKFRLDKLGREIGIRETRSNKIELQEVKTKLRA